MLSSTIGTEILNSLFARYKASSYMDFSGDVYIGLLTKLPNDDESAYSDGTYFSEPADEGYFRIRIDTASRITKTPFMANAISEDAVAVGEDMAIPASISNQSMIMFPESNVDWDTVVGFGLFRDKTGTDLPFLWGSVTSEDGTEGVTIEQYEVPIVRSGGFKVSLM